MKQKITTALLVFLCINTSFSQNRFQEIYGNLQNDNASFGFETSDGNYLIGGSSRIPSNSNRIASLIKVDKRGDTLWTKHYADQNQIDIKNGINTSDGGFVFTGNYINQSNAINGILFKTDSAGNMMWSKSYSNQNSIYNLDLIESSTGGYVFTGYQLNSLIGLGSFDMVLTKTDAFGNPLWSQLIGGAQTDFSYSLKECFDGGYILAGFTRSYSAIGGRPYMVKTDSLGNISWGKNFGSNSGGNLYSIVQMPDSGFVACGYIEGFGQGKKDVLLLKASSQGNFEWMKTYGTSEDNIARKLILDPNGFLLIAGTSTKSSNSDQRAFLMKTNFLADSIWTRTYGASSLSEANSVSFSSDKGYLLAGYTYDRILSTNNQHSNNMYLIKTDSMGSSSCNEESSGFIKSFGTPAINTGASNVIDTGSTSLTLVTRSNMMYRKNYCLSVGNPVFLFEESTSLDRVNIYPNPFNEVINLEFYSKESNSAQLMVYDILGKEILNRELSNSKNIQINANKIEKGIYFYRLSLNNNRIIQEGKLVKINK